MLYNFFVYAASLVLLPVYRLKVRGKENIPQGAAVVCGNHTARSDVVMVFLALFYHKERPAIIAKAELFKNPIAKWFFSYMGAFPIHRGSADLNAIKTSLSALKQGKKLIIFPEGTRVKEGMEAVEAKSGSAMFAQRTNSPVLPVYITPGKKALRGCTVTFGEPFFMTKELIGQDYQMGAKLIMEHIEEVYQTQVKNG